MLRLARLKPPAAVAAALMILATGWVAVQGRQQPGPEGTRKPARTALPPAAVAALPDAAANQALARRQLTLIDETLDALHHLAQTARVSLSDPRFSLWDRRRLEALRKAGAGKAEIVAALEKSIESLKGEEQIAKALKERAQGTQIDISDVQFRRMEAEIWLNEEKAR